MKRNWPVILQAQRDSGLSIEAFCRIKKLARSNFYVARARAQSMSASRVIKPGAQRGLLPVMITKPAQIAVTIQLEASSIRLHASASDIAQLLHCL
jgi:hypothetical protein